MEKMELTDTQHEKSSLHRVMTMHGPTAYFTATPAREDVLLGRGKKNQQHLGNISFIKKIDECVGLYHESERGKKREIVFMIMDWLADRNGHFVKLSPEGYWVEVSESIAKNKVAQAFRHRNSLRQVASHPQKTQQPTVQPQLQSLPHNITDILVQRSRFEGNAAEQLNHHIASAGNPGQQPAFYPVEASDLRFWEELIVGDVLPPSMEFFDDGYMLELLLR